MGLQSWGWSCGCFILPENQRHRRRPIFQPPSGLHRYLPKDQTWPPHFCRARGKDGVMAIFQGLQAEWGSGATRGIREAPGLKRARGKMATPCTAWYWPRNACLQTQWRPVATQLVLLLRTAQFQPGNDVNLNVLERWDASNTSPFQEEKTSCSFRAKTAVPWSPKLNISIS